VKAPLLVYRGQPARDRTHLSRRKAALPKRPLRIGVWDAGARLGALGALLARLAAAQDGFAFFEVLAPVPAGMARSAETVRAWLRQRQLAARRSFRLGPRVLGSELAGRGEAIRLALDLDAVLALSRSLFLEAAREPAAAHVAASSHGRVVLVSSAGIRPAAPSAGRPVSSLLLRVALPRLLAALFPKLRLHPPRGCLLDQRDEAPADTLGWRPGLEASCRALLPRGLRPPLDALLAALAEETA
jgi:hypothetical protein